MPPRCLLLQHSEAAAPGRVGEALEALGWEAQTIRPFAGEAVPRTPPADCAVLVVLGGLMSVHDEAEHPFLADEKRLLRWAVAEVFPSLGTSVVAQLRARVATGRATGSRPRCGLGAA